MQIKLKLLTCYPSVWRSLRFCFLWTFSGTFWERKCGEEKRNPQCAINSHDNDLLTKQSSGLHIAPHCFLRMLTVKSWANISLWYMHTGFKKCVIVRPCISRTWQTTARGRTMTPALTFTTCLSAFNLFALSFQGAEALWAICLDHSSDCDQPANCRITRQQFITAFVRHETICGRALMFILCLAKDSARLSETS